MGALEFTPPISAASDEAAPVEIAGLVALAGEITSARGQLSPRLDGDTGDALFDILRVGTSAGGARAKVVIAINAAGEVRSGQTEPPPALSTGCSNSTGSTIWSRAKPRGMAAANTPTT